MTKKSILATLGIVAAGFLFGAPSAHADRDQKTDAPGARHATDPFSGDKLYGDVIFYSSLGEHRTATATDYATEAWLALRLKALGFSVELLPFSTNQFYPTETSVTVGGKSRIQAFPVWWPTPTRGAGQTGKLTTDLANVSGKIYLFDNASGTVNQSVQNTIKTAAANGATGVIVVLTQAATPSQEIYGQNAQQLVSYDPSADPGAGDQTPWTIPVVTIGRSDRPTLQNAIDNSLDVKLRSEGFFKTGATSNVVIGTLNRGPADKTLLVSTPSSGWFEDAGERGTGVAVWLALAEWAAKETSGVKWVFMSSSGHELNFRGTNAYLKSPLVPPPSDVYLWTHLGADVITYDYSSNSDGTLTRTDQPVKQYVKYNTANASILAALDDSFLPANPQAKALNILGLQNSIGGDLTYAKFHGYSNLLYFAGGNPTFHTHQDTPETSSPQILEPIARLIKSALQEVVSGL